MQESREYKVSVSNFNHQFTGTISSLSSTKNPYLKMAEEIAKEKGIPLHFVQNTKIMVRGTDVTFNFKWNVEVETPQKDKLIVLAYIDDMPKDDEDVYIPVFIKIESDIYKTYIYDRAELENDYIFNDKSKQLKESEENDYIDSLNIDFEKRYLEALIKLSEDYSDYKVSNEQLKEFLKIKYVRAFILEECSESLSDTSPREVLLNWIKTEFPEEY